MGSLINWLSNNSESIEVGVITEKEGDKSYRALIAGSDKRVYNTLSESLSIGNRVLISKLKQGKRYIINNTGFNDSILNTGVTTEVLING